MLVLLIKLSISSSKLPRTDDGGRFRTFRFCNQLGGRRPRPPMLRNVAVLALATIAAGFGPAAIIREPDDALDQTMCAEPDAPAETIGPILAEFLRPDLLSCNQVGTAIFDSVYSGCDVLSTYCPCNLL